MNKLTLLIVFIILLVAPLNVQANLRAQVYNLQDQIDRDIAQTAMIYYTTTGVLLKEGAWTIQRKYSYVANSSPITRYERRTSITNITTTSYVEKPQFSIRPQATFIIVIQNKDGIGRLVGVTKEDFGKWKEGEQYTGGIGIIIPPIYPSLAELENKISNPEKKP